MSGQMQVSSAGTEGLEAMMTGIPIAQTREIKAAEGEGLEMDFSALLDQGLVELVLKETGTEEVADTEVASEDEAEATEMVFGHDMLANVSLAVGLFETEECTEIPGSTKTAAGHHADKIVNTIQEQAVEVVELQSEPANLKRDQMGVETMLNDLPEHWESLLEDQSASEPDGATDTPLVEKQDASHELNSAKNQEVLIKEQSTLSLPFDQGNSDFSESQSQAESRRSLIMKASALENQAEANASVDEMSFNQALKTGSYQSTTRASGSNAMHLLQNMNDVQRQSVIKSFSQDTVKGLKGKEERLQIELNPPELGRVQVVVQRSGEQVHARIVIADAQLGEFFQEHLEQIRKTIESSGMQLGEFSLEVGQQSQTEQQDDLKQQVGTNQKEGGSVTGERSVKSSKTSRTQPTKTSKVDMLI